MKDDKESFTSLAVRWAVCAYRVWRGELHLSESEARLWSALEALRNEANVHHFWTRGSWTPRAVALIRRGFGDLPAEGFRLKRSDVLSLKGAGKLIVEEVHAGLRSMGQDWEPEDATRCRSLVYGRVPCDNPIVKDGLCIYHARRVKGQAKGE